MDIPATIADYLRLWAPQLGDRIVQMYPALHTVADSGSPLLGRCCGNPSQLKN